MAVFVVVVGAVLWDELPVMVVVVEDEDEEDEDCVDVEVVEELVVDEVFVE